MWCWQKKVATLVLVICVVVSMLPLLLLTKPVAAAATWNTMSSGSTCQLMGVWGSSATDVFAVGESPGGTILHYDGHAWSSINTNYFLRAVWGTSASDVWAAGASDIFLHYDGSAWSAVNTGLGLAGSVYAIWGSSYNDIFAVGSFNLICHYNGTAWSLMSQDPINGLPWHGVWGTSSSNVFAVGTAGAMLHYDGSAWSAMSSGVSNDLYGIWGTSSSNVFAVSIGGDMLHYDGSTWSHMTSGEGYWLTGVWGTSASDVFAVGGVGNILHYNGTAWSVMTSTSTQPLWGVWGSSPTDVFTVGDGGTILHYAEAPCGSTPVGSNVTVPLCGASIEVTFTSVSVAGTTTAIQESAPCGSLPSSYTQRGAVYHITTTATYSGNVIVSITYPSGIPTPSDLRLFHCNGTGWSDVTYGAVDTALHIIHGQDATLSWWAIGDPPEPGGGGGGGQSAPVFPSIYIGIGAALGAGIVAYAVRRRLAR